MKSGIMRKIREEICSFCGILGILLLIPLVLSIVPMGPALLYLLLGWIYDGLATEESTLGYIVYALIAWISVGGLVAFLTGGFTDER